MASPRQVLYALVALAFHVVVAVLVIAGWTTGAVRGSVTVLLAGVWSVATVVMASGWRRTPRMLAASMSVFVLWAVLTVVGR